MLGKNINGLIFVLSIILLVFATLYSMDGSSDATILNGGECGDSLNWEVEGKVLKITGGGGMYSYVNNSQPWTSYKTSIEEMIISDSVTSLGEDAFNGCSSLKTLTIPITLDASKSFSGCNSITAVHFTPGVDGKGCDYSYYEYEHTPWYRSKNVVTNVTFENGIKSIGSNALRSCSKITSLVFPDTLTSISSYAFKDCTGLTSVSIPFSLKTIKSDAFYGLIFYDTDSTTKITDYSKLCGYNYVRIDGKMVRQPDTNHFTIYFNSNGGTAVNSQAMYRGYKVTKPSDPTKIGYTFKEWVLNGTAFDFSTPVIESMTLIASWTINKYTISFNSNGGSSIPSQVVEYNSMASKPIDPTISGFKFNKWLLNGVEYDFSTPIVSDITLTAVWSKDNQHVVTFDTADGTAIPMQTISHGSKVVRPGNPSREGYMFNNWMLGDSIYNFGNPVDADIILVASWTPNIYSVSFDSNGGSYVSSQRVEYGKFVTQPTNPTKNGYVFKEWQLNGNAFSFNQHIREDITLVALWESEGSYVVSFDTTGGSVISAITVESGKAIASPENPTKEGHIFKGWVLNGIEYDFTSQVTSNITLVALWEAKTFIITFDSNGGTTVESQNVSYGSSVKRPSNPTKDGSNFSEWQLDGQTFSFSTSITGDLMLTAKWVPSGTWTVTFDTNGGSSISSQLVSNGKTAYEPSVPTRQGYYFDGWKVNGSDYNFNNPLYSNIYLTASWVAEPSSSDSKNDGSVAIVIVTTLVAFVIVASGVGGFMFVTHNTKYILRKLNRLKIEPPR